MAKKTETRGLQLRGGIWHMDKVVRGVRICGSCETSDFNEAARILQSRVEITRAETERGVRPIRTFRDASIKYLDENGYKRSIGDDADALKDLDPFIGAKRIDEVHWDSLKEYREARLHLAAGTTNRRLAVVRMILDLAANLWRHNNGMTWIAAAPLIPNVIGKKRKPYPLDWDEQALLFSELAAHLAEMSTFKVNSGTRDDEVCKLQWAWEHRIEGVCSVFVIPVEVAKNTNPEDQREHVVVCNETAQAIIEARRGKHPTHVFTYTPPATKEERKAGIEREAAPVDRMHGSGWRSARRRAAARYEEELGRPCPWGFRNIRVHDLKHTFGRRLRAAGVGFEDRQDLLGHRGGSVTTDYSVAEIGQLLKAANLVNESRRSHTASLLKVVVKDRCVSASHATKSKAIVSA